MLSQGICILGGCCGTDDAVIRALHAVARDFSDCPDVPAPVETDAVASTSREIAEIPVSDMPEPIEADDDLIDNAEEMSDDYDFLYIAVRSKDDAETVLDAAPFLTLPIAVCGDEEGIAALKRGYCGKLVILADNG